MTIGEKRTIGDYSYYETLHGPMVWGTCIDCGEPALKVGRTDRVNAHGLKEDTGGGIDTRCSTCGRKHYGLI